MAPANSSSFSVSVVLPASGWEMMAKVLRRWTSCGMLMFWFWSRPPGRFVLCNLCSSAPAEGSQYRAGQDKHGAEAAVHPAHMTRLAQQAQHAGSQSGVATHGHQISQAERTGNDEVLHRQWLGGVQELRHHRHQKDCALWVGEVDQAT